MTAKKILIADDEPGARDLIRHYLEETADDYTILETADGRSTLETLAAQDIQILFLDIKMPELTGLEVLNQFNRGKLPAIIFTTAYDEYALPAFDHEAIDYLLNPFSKERFLKALQRAQKFLELRHHEYPKNLAVKSGTKTLMVPVTDIEFLQADGVYVQVVTQQKNFLLSEPLYELEQKFDPAIFIRIHRSTILNVHRIKEIQSLMNGDYLVKLNSGKTVRASRTYRERLKALYGKI